MKISDNLKHGKENAMSIEALQGITLGFDKRKIMSIIQKERAEGEVILASSKGGYFLPDEGEKGTAEIMEYYRIHSARIKWTLRFMGVLRKIIDERKNGQVTFDIEVRQDE